jgi:hypothetical protein
MHAALAAYGVPFEVECVVGGARRRLWWRAHARRTVSYDCETGHVVGATGMPDMEMAHEESLQPDLAVWTDVCDVQSAAERVLTIVARLARRLRRAAEAG